MEIHPFHQQEIAHEIMKDKNVQIQAWAPFAEGKNNLFTNPVLTEVGQKYGKSAAQVTLRFLIQKGISVLPKSVQDPETVERLVNFVREF